MTPGQLNLIITKCESFDGAPIEQGSILRDAFDLLNAGEHGYRRFRFVTLIHVSGHENAALLLLPEGKTLDLAINAIRPGHDGLWTLASLTGHGADFTDAKTAAWARLPALAMLAAILKAKCQELVKYANTSHFTPTTPAQETADASA